MKPSPARLLAGKAGRLGPPAGGCLGSASFLPASSPQSGEIRRREISQDSLFPRKLKSFLGNKSNFVVKLFQGPHFCLSTRPFSTDLIMEPSYLKVTPEELKKLAQKASELLNPCRVCPRDCKVDRNSKVEKLGFCQMGATARIFAYHSHFGEESCLVGRNGSGTIFFSSCNLACIYCQNWEISQLRLGNEVTNERLGEMMIELQKQGCHNINLVSPTIWVPQILKALTLAIKNGLKIPLVYNTGGYDSVETLKLLEGIVDIYMPDIKYSDNKVGLKYSSAPDYWNVVREATKEMHRQVGDLLIEDGLAQMGLLIRHLVLPDDLAGTKKVMKFLAEEISPNTYVNIMAQYWPTHKADRYHGLSRRITREEFEEAIKTTREAGLWRFDKV